jgi:hypothetical protein
VDPDPSEVGIGETFIAKVRILNVVDLYGLDIIVGWDTALINYLNHTITIPVETYIDGILHEPVLEIKNDINTTLGTYWIASTSLYPAEPFNGSGVVAEIAFEAIAAGICDFTVGVEIADVHGTPISHAVTPSSITIHDFHDIAITDLSIGKTVIAECYCTNISVFLINQGAFPEDFNVTLHANGTLIDETSTHLVAGDSDAIDFIWNTTGWDKGYYILGASVPPVTNETDTADNEYTEVVLLTIPGDVDGDCDVDIFDAVTIATTYGCCLDDLRYNPACDIDNDGDIDIFDIVIATDNYGEEWQPPPGNGGSVGFEDDFESYEVGMVPSGWMLVFNGAGNAYQIVVDHVSVSPTNCLQLVGAPSWAADAVRFFYSDDPIVSFEVYVQVADITWTAEHNSRVGFWSLKSNGWARWYCAVVFLDDGTIKCGGQVLQSYEAGVWYKVKQVFDRDANVLSVWIDDVLQGADIPGPTEYSGYGIQGFALSGRYSGVTTYYDDVTITSNP